ncbi:MAG: hypothetical protein EXR79_10305 [Myxococcales bacterium]|nr:hypothetical protein [Myxococcales bacterium]
MRWTAHGPSKGLAVEMNRLCLECGTPRSEAVCPIHGIETLEFDESKLGARSPFESAAPVVDAPARPGRPAQEAITQPDVASAPPVWRALEVPRADDAPPRSSPAAAGTTQPVTAKRERKEGFAATRFEWMEAHETRRRLGQAAPGAVATSADAGVQTADSAVPGVGMAAQAVSSTAHIPLTAAPAALQAEVAAAEEAAAAAPPQPVRKAARLPAAKPRSTGARAPTQGPAVGSLLPYGLVLALCLAAAGVWWYVKNANQPVGRRVRDPQQGAVEWTGELGRAADAAKRELTAALEPPPDPADARPRVAGRFTHDEINLAVADTLAVVRACTMGKKGKRAGSAFHVQVEVDPAGLVCNALLRNRSKLAGATAACIEKAATTALLPPGAQAVSITLDYDLKAPPGEGKSNGPRPAAASARE